MLESFTEQQRVFKVITAEIVYLNKILKLLNTVVEVIK